MPLLDEFIIDDLEVLKVIAHSTRLDILQLLKVPKTVKTIAELLQRPPTKLYYHVNLMEKNGLIQVVDTNIISGIVEKTYQVVAHNYSLQDGLLASSDSFSEDVDSMLEAIFDVTRKEIKRSIQANQLGATKEDRRGILSHSGLRLTAVQFATYYNKLETILKELEALSQENHAAETAVDQSLYGITIAYYPNFQPTPEEDATS